MDVVIGLTFLLVGVGAYYVLMASKFEKLLEKRQNCKHKFYMYRICENCGLKQRGAKNE